jgi:hypothetical protein
MFDISILILISLLALPLSGLLMLPYLVEKMTAMELAPIKSKRARNRNE